MAIFCALAIYVSNLDYQTHVDGVVVTGALGIGLVAVYTLVDHIFQLGWLPQFIKDEMYLQVGLHDGYVQMNNVNIGMLTFIAPYLLSRVLLGEREKTWHGSSWACGRGGICRACLAQGSAGAVSSRRC